jgi:hypothetical protein
MEKDMSETGEQWRKRGWVVGEYGVPAMVRHEPIADADLARSVVGP